MTMTDAHRFKEAIPGWTEERVKRLIELHKEGLPRSLIAARLGGVSRNAVIGKLARLGYACDGARPRTSRPAAPRVPREPRPPRPRRSTFAFGSPLSLVAQDGLPLPTPQESDAARVSFNDLEPKHCRFIPGEPIGLRPHDPQFCGLDVVPGFSYCRAHALRCFALPGYNPRIPNTPTLVLVDDELQGAA